MQLPIYQVDAFTSTLFGGNPAAVCPLQQWLPDDLMQRIAFENNLSETAFFVPENDGFYIRWFTPATEVALCGHATLATAHVLFQHLGCRQNPVVFYCKSGKLTVQSHEANRYTLNFPANPPTPVTDIPDGMLEGLGIAGAAVFSTSFDYMVILPSQKDVEALQPNFNALARVKARGVIVSAKGDTVDFVSRCFYPQSGVNEDPVTGSAHTILAPYWAGILQKQEMKAMQLSARKGWLELAVKEDRVHMSGSGVTFMTGEIHI